MQVIKPMIEKLTSISLELYGFQQYVQEEMALEFEAKTDDEKKKDNKFIQSLNDARTDILDAIENLKPYSKEGV